MDFGGNDRVLRSEAHMASFEEYVRSTSESNGIRQERGGRRGVRCVSVKVRVQGRQFEVLQKFGIIMPV